MNTQNKNTEMLQQVTDLLQTTTEISYYLDLLKIVSSEYLVVFSVKDTPGSKMPSSVVQKIHELGLSKFDTKLWLMYAGILYKSAVLLDRSGEKPEKSVSYECSVNGCQISVSSESYKGGNRASLLINGTDYALNNRGVNIAVYDTENHVLIDSVSFDNHEKPSGTFTRKDRKTVLCSNIDIESTIVQINNKIDALTKTVALNDFKMNFIYWNNARAEGETSLDAKKRFFKSLQTENYEMSILQKSTTILLEEFGKICDQNGIDYWLDFGTLLGAIRHNGFIPWDDDIDVSMLRKDIPKLVKAFSEADTCAQISNYFVIAGDVCNICRIIFKDSSLKYFVDIFIYDTCGSDSDSIWGKYRKSRSDFISQAIKFRPVPVADPNLNFWEQRRVTDQEHTDAINSILNTLHEGYVEENGDYIIWGLDNVSYSNGKKGIRKASDIFPLKKLEFCGRLYNVPNEFEKHVELRYGDLYVLPNDMFSHIHVNQTPDMIKKSLEMIERYYGEHL